MNVWLTVWPLLVGALTTQASWEAEETYQDGFECPSNFPIARNDSCYFFSETTHQLSWGNAQASCRQRGGFLAHSRSLEEEQFFETYFRTNYDMNVFDYMWWLGASDIDEEGTWIWEEGSEDVVYNDWLVDMPSDEPGEDCMVFRKGENYDPQNPDFGWDDRNCTEQLLSICELKI